MKLKEVPEGTPGAFIAFDANGNRVGLLRREPPTFDEWFTERHGRSFEVMCQTNGTRFVDTMNALTRAVRDYVTEVARS